MKTHLNGSPVLFICWAKAQSTWNYLLIWKLHPVVGVWLKEIKNRSYLRLHRHNWTFFGLLITFLLWFLSVRLHDIYMECNYMNNNFNFFVLLLWAPTDLSTKTVDKSVRKVYRDLKIQLLTDLTYNFTICYERNSLHHPSLRLGWCACARVVTLYKRNDIV